jgi:hypothetical protein
MNDKPLMTFDTALGESITFIEVYDKKEGKPISVFTPQGYLLYGDEAYMVAWLNENVRKDADIG